jgi:hypothetical protein
MQITRIPNGFYNLGARRSLQRGIRIIRVSRLCPSPAAYIGLCPTTTHSQQVNQSARKEKKITDIQGRATATLQEISTPRSTLRLDLKASDVWIEEFLFSHWIGARSDVPEKLNSLADPG